jgi:hypothetical protein
MATSGQVAGPVSPGRSGIEGSTRRGRGRRTLSARRRQHERRGGLYRYGAGEYGMASSSSTREHDHGEMAAGCRLVPAWGETDAYVTATTNTHPAASEPPALEPSKYTHAPFSRPRLRLKAS